MKDPRDLTDLANRMSELVQEREEKRKLLYYMRYTQAPEGILIDFGALAKGK